jgi:hypothetical protein
LLPELGIIGVILFFQLLWYNLKDLFLMKKIHSGTDREDRYLHNLSVAFICSLAGFFASATFLSVLYYAHYWYVTALIVATSGISARIMSERKLA